MCNLWVSNGSEISWPCIISAAAEIEHCFFFIIIIPGKMKLLISGTHKQGGRLDVLFYTKYSVAGRTVLYLFVLLSAFRACVQKPWMAIKHTHLKKTKKHWTHYNTRTVAHSFGSNNYNLTAVINFAYRR